jgi:hypothetical protein
MPFSRLRLAARAVVSIAVAAVPLAATAAGVQAATSPLTLAVHVGYHDTIKLGDWMPVTIDLTNAGPSLEGLLEVQTASSLPGGGPPGGTVVYQIPVSLTTGAAKHVRTFALVDQPGSVTVRLLQNGRVIASQQANASNTTGILIGVLSDQPDMLRDLATISPGGLSTSVVHLTADDLTESALVLRPFDMLAIDDFSTDTLTAAQRTGVVDYVTNGGSLLLGTGGAWHKTLGGLPDAIVPLRGTGSRILGPLAALGGANGIELMTGGLRAGDAWLSAGADPLMVESAVGQGTVELATFDWGQEPLAGSTGTTVLLRQSFVRSSFAAGPSSVASGNPFGFSVAMKGGTLAQALVNLPALDLPAWWVIGGLVLIYVLLVGPVNYFVLRALNRRMLAWITVPAIAVVAAGGAYGGSILTKGTSAQANQITIIHVAQDSNRGWQEAYTGLLTPTRGDYRVGIGAGRPLISAIDYYNGALDQSQGLVRVDTTSPEITLPGMTAFTLRAFATESITTAPRLAAHATLVGGKLTGTIQNLSSTTFTDGILVAGGAYQKFGALKPGASVTFNVTPSATNPLTGQPGYMQAYPSAVFGGAPAADMSAGAQREATAKAAILSTLPINGFKGISMSVIPTVVAWTNQPLERITVNGARPRSYAETGVVLTVPVDHVSKGSVPAGVIAGRFVDIDGDVQPQGGPPGVVVLQNGSITFDFAPNLEPGLHLTGASIVSSNPFGAKGIPANGAETGSDVHAQVWDWAQSRWIAVTYADNASTAVPDSAVNPANGQVRLKLSSDGGFTSGWLSLAGEAR